MEQLFKFIEDKIKESGYTGKVDGKEIYNEISDEIEDKDNGTYIFMSKKEDDLVFEYRVDVMNDDFNLSYIGIVQNETRYHSNFDE